MQHENADQTKHTLNSTYYLSNRCDFVPCLGVSLRSIHNVKSCIIMIHSIINKKANVQRYADFISYYKIAKTKGLFGFNALEYANCMTAGIFYK